MIGYGNSFFLTNQSILAGGGGPAVDTDAQAFITAASITDPTQQTAINDLVIGLKADGLWTSARAIYPFVGGTSTTHKWNLRNPLDTNAAFRLTFGGGITHSSSGIKGNSLNGYYETYLNPSTEFSLATGGCGFVAINENLDTSTDFGAFQTGVNYRFQLTVKAGNTTYAAMLSNSFYSASNTASTIGFYGVTRQPNDNSNFYTIQNATNIATAGAYQEPNSTINGFALNIDGVLKQIWGERRQSFAYYGEGLTTAQAQLLRARVNTFNTTLGR